MLQAEGIADRHHEVADLGLGRVAEGDLRQPVGLHFEHRDVGGRVAADDFGLEVAAVLQRHGDLAGVLDHVRVGDDVAVAGVENHARAGALERPLARAGIRRHVEEAAKERVIEQRVLRAALANGAARGDVDHRRGDLLIIGASDGSGVSPDRRRHGRRQRRGGERGASATATSEECVA